MLTKTQALKDALQNTNKAGESFSQVRMGVGQEFVSIIKIDRQEDMNKTSIKRNIRNECSPPALGRNDPSKV